METLKMNEIYQEIANKLIEIIPDEWDEIFLYGEVLADGREVYFYFKSSTNRELVYSHDIPDTYNVDKRIYRQLLRELRNEVVKLHEEYESNNEEVWSNLSLFLDKNGKFNIKFNYDDILDLGFLPYERQVIWEYNVLNQQPVSNEEKEIIKRYLDNLNKQN